MPAPNLDSKTYQCHEIAKLKAREIHHSEILILSTGELRSIKGGVNCPISESAQQWWENYWKANIPRAKTFPHVLNFLASRNIVVPGTEQTAWHRVCHSMREMSPKVFKTSELFIGTGHTKNWAKGELRIKKNGFECPAPKSLRDWWSNLWTRPENQATARRYQRVMDFLKFEGKSIGWQNSTMPEPPKEQVTKKAASKTQPKEKTLNKSAQFAKDWDAFKKATTVKLGDFSALSKSFFANCSEKVGNNYSTSKQNVYFLNEKDVKSGSLAVAVVHTSKTSRGSVVQNKRYQTAKYSKNTSGPAKYSQNMSVSIGQGNKQRKVDVSINTEVRRAGDDYILKQEIRAHGTLILTKYCKTGESDQYARNIESLNIRQIIASAKRDLLLRSPHHFTWRRPPDNQFIRLRRHAWLESIGLENESPV